MLPIPRNTTAFMRAPFGYLVSKRCEWLFSSKRCELWQAQSRIAGFTGFIGLEAKENFQVDPGSHISRTGQPQHVFSDALLCSSPFISRTETNLLESNLGE